MDKALEHLSEDIYDGVFGFISAKFHNILCGKCRRRECIIDCPKMETMEDLTEQMCKGIIEYMNSNYKTLYMLKKLGERKNPKENV